MNNSADIFDLYPAKTKCIGILSIPHSGELLPDEFTEYLTPTREFLMRDVDFRVNELVNLEELQDAGITIIKSNIIRTAIDLNRPKDLSLLNWKSNSKGEKVVLQEPNTETAQLLIEKYYSPYYETLNAIIQSLHNSFSIPSFIDLHSMPSVAEQYHLKMNPHQERQRPDFCISDIEGLSCEEDFIQNIGQELNQVYPAINYNNPYFGGHITEHYNSTVKPLNNIQIEISRAIYMDEKSQTLIAEKVKLLNSVLTKALRNQFTNYAKKYLINS
ncbi:MAG: N-formylglutamate amidohydrolase [Halobacteriovoraceae bacterium]|jgi:N-formylglutamate amidohydrolase|nr:N-formylglutamate amidohydrolase [Halobacteriovoraceae bacterium]